MLESSSILNPLVEQTAPAVRGASWLRPPTVPPPAHPPARLFHAAARAARRLATAPELSRPPTGASTSSSARQLQPSVAEGHAPPRHIAACRAVVQQRHLCATCDGLSLVASVSSQAQLQQLPGHFRAVQIPQRNSPAPGRVSASAARHQAAYPLLISRLIHQALARSLQNDGRRPGAPCCRPPLPRGPRVCEA